MAVRHWLGPDLIVMMVIIDHNDDADHNDDDYHDNYNDNDDNSDGDD